MSPTGPLRARYGPCALVTGGAQGIGTAFAEACAAGGLDLVLVALPGEEVEARAHELAARHGVEAVGIELDLAEPGFWERLAPHLAGREVGMLVCNAAASAIGEFTDTPLEAKLRMIDVNCRAPTVLCHELVPPMVARGRGGVILLASLAGFQGAPLVATYAATKAFDLVLGESLWFELREAGVDAMAVCPGPTRTPGFEATPPRPGSRAPRPMEPAEVARESLAALGRGPSFVPGRANRMTRFVVSRLLSRRAAVSLFGRTTRSMYGRRPGPPGAGTATGSRAGSGA